jgi:ATP-dependent Lon protease
MCTALASLFTGRLPQPLVAMTGEITLRGRVLPIGGVQLKVLGAHRMGIRKVVLPKRNEHDVEDVPDEVREQLELVFVEHVSEVLEHTLMSKDQSERARRDPDAAQ